MRIAVEALAPPVLAIQVPEGLLLNKRLFFSAACSHESVIRKKARWISHPLERMHKMISQERLVNAFTSLVAIDSLTRGERLMADELLIRLRALGHDPQEDGTALKIGGNAGNIVCRVPGNPMLSPVLLMSHMDTVVPGLGKRAVIDGDLISSDGTTILGGDDLAGVSVILETVQVLRETGREHGDVWIAFTVAEEGGLFGAVNLDTSAIPAKYAFILDDEGPIGSAAIKAPFYNRLAATFRGRAAHAGLEPEKGLSAILMAAKAIAALPHFGRIDAETTSNIGILQGGTARNIVTETCRVEGEVRSTDVVKIEQYTDQWVNAMNRTAMEMGGSVEILRERMYPGYFLSPEDPIIRVLGRAAEKAGVPLNLHATGGGSDTNVINGKGIPAVDISVGMEQVHSTKERIRISNMVKAAEFLVEIVCEAALS